MPSTLAPAAAQPEPTLRDVLNAVNGLGTRMDSLETRFDGLETRFDGLETRFDGLERRIDGLETRFDGLETRFDGLERRIDGLETRFDGLERRFDGLETRFDGLERRFDGLETRFDGLERRFDGLEDRMVTVEHEIKDLRFFAGEQFAHTTTEIAKLRAADKEHLERFERIDVKLDEVIRLCTDNQRIGLKNQEDIARIDRKLDAHLADREIHLPRPRSMDLPEIGPIAA